jgi:hypothetical protein
LDVYYEMLDLLIKLEPYAERAALNKKASKRMIAKEAKNIKFLADLFRGMTTDYNDLEVPYALTKRIDKERRKREEAESILAARIKNIKSDNQSKDERVKKLRAAVEEMKRKNEERKKESEQ